MIYDAKQLPCSVLTDLAAGTNIDPAAAVKMWTDESGEYDPANPSYSHFTQGQLCLLRVVAEFDRTSSIHT